MRKTKVSIVKGPLRPTDEQIYQTVSEAIKLAGGLPNNIGAGDRVIIKPNVVLPHVPEESVTTDPRVCESIAKIVIGKGATPIIAESSAVGIDTEEAFKEAGYGQLRKKGYEVVDLKKKGTETLKVAVPEGKSLKELLIPRLILEAKAIISVPKIKTHNQSLVTLSLKNMKGILPDAIKKKFHTTFGVFQACADLATVVKADFSVVDGITGMEGFGPVLGDIVDMGLIIAGRDPVAVDAVTSVVIGFGPREDPIVDASACSNVGTANLSQIEIVGEPISKVRRRFKHCSEALQESVIPPKGFELLLGERTCSACRGTVFALLYNMKNCNRLDEMSGLCLVTGKTNKLPITHKGTLVLVGACTAKFKDSGIFVDGCPPNGSYITESLGLKPIEGFSSPNSNDLM